MITIAINIIIGPGDAKCARRCLKAAQLELFDEIVLGPNGNDPEVNALCNEYKHQDKKVKVIPVTWRKDFADARNQILENTVSDFVFWLDADDRIREVNKKSLAGLLDMVKKGTYPVYYRDTVLDHGARLLKGRDRIFQRKDAKWIGQLHEQIAGLDRSKKPMISGIVIDHLPEKKAEVSLLRNIEIMEETLKKIPIPLNEYHLAREYLGYARAHRDNNRDKWDKGVLIMDQLINARSMNNDLVADMLMTRAMDELYDGSMMNLTKDPKRLAIAETYCYLGLSIKSNVADFHTMLGDMDLAAGDSGYAIKHYEAALACKMDDCGTYFAINYQWKPYVGLMDCYLLQDAPEMALLYNRKALELECSQALIDTRDKILKAMAESWDTAKKQFEEENA
jgi:glycosyltransferase involved in cell wall biosynthesis